MKKFIVHFYTPEKAVAELSIKSPEEKKELMEPWMKWKKEMSDRLIDVGSPMIADVRIYADGTESHIDSELNGYEVIVAKDIEEARAILRDHPHLKMWEKSYIEIFETFNV